MQKNMDYYDLAIGQAFMFEYVEAFFKVVQEAVESGYTVVLYKRGKKYVIGVQ